MRNRILLITIFIFTGIMAKAQPGVTEPKIILPGESTDLEVVAVSQSYVATGSWDKTIKLYGADSPYKLVKTLTGHLAPITALKFSRDGRLLASGTSDNNIRIWDSVFRVMRIIDGHPSKINCLLFDAARKYLFSGGEDRQIMIWEIATGKMIRSLDFGQPVYSLAQSNDPKYLYASGADTKIKIFNLATGQLIRTSLDGHTDAINSIAISPNNQYLISGSNDKTARLWSLKTFKEVRKLPVDCWKVTAVSFSSDSRYAVTGCNDGSLKMWEVETGKLTSAMGKEGENIRAVSMSSNLKNIYVASMLRSSTDYGLRIWPGVKANMEPAPAADSTLTTSGNPETAAPAVTPVYKKPVPRKR